MTFAGIKVPKQEVGLVNLGAGTFDGVSSGILGLAFSALTVAYTGTKVSEDVRDTPRNPNATSNRKPYSGIVHTMFFTENLSDPVFALALSPATDPRHSSAVF